MKLKKNSLAPAMACCWLLLVATGLTGCSRSLTWKEEVQLSDTRVVVVEREILDEGGGDEWAANRSMSKPKEYVIRYIEPTTSPQRIEWRSTRKSPRQWPEIPLVLDVENGQPVVFSIVATSEVCEMYVKYVYRNGVWSEVVLPGTFERRTTNLFLRLGTDMPTFVGLQQKQLENASDDYRQSLKQVGPNLRVCG